MEVKVSVDGISRVVCGVTEETTCQEVVVALAQALGQPGRYMLRENFKDFERCMTPSERLLETLEKYGEHAREVQLTLHLNGPSSWEEMSRKKFGRYHPCPPLRRKDAGTRMRRGSSSLSLHRQSLPPLPCLRQEAERPKEELKRPKRKSLTLMEEAWEWLENLGKSKVYSTASDKESSRRNDKKKFASSDVSLTDDTDIVGRGSRSRVRGQKSLKSVLDHETSCCIGSQTRDREGKHFKKRQGAKSNDLCRLTEDEKERLKETVLSQLSCLQDLHVQIACTDKQILELEEKQWARATKWAHQQRMAADETELIKFWENELKAQEGFEKDLQCQFLEMRAKAVECKAKLEDYKQNIQGLDIFGTQVPVEEESEMNLEVGACAVTEIPAADANQVRSDPDGDVNFNRKLLPRQERDPPHALVSAGQIKERRPTGPRELREWWTRWSEAQNTQLHNKKKVVHRSELTVYLGSTKV